MDSPPRSLSDRLYRREGIVALVKYHLRTYSHSIRSPQPPPPLVSDNFWLVRSEQPTPKEKPGAERASGGGGGSGPKGLGRKDGEAAAAAGSALGRVRLRRRHRKRVRSMQLTSVGSLSFRPTNLPTDAPHRNKQAPNLSNVVG